jgi:hypothetical protein
MSSVLINEILVIFVVAFFIVFRDRFGDDFPCKEPFPFPSRLCIVMKSIWAKIWRAAGGMEGKMAGKPDEFSLQSVRGKKEAEIKDKKKENNFTKLNFSKRMG